MKSINYSPKANEVIYKINDHFNVRIWLTVFIIFLILSLFVPWTQNIKSEGLITTIEQDYRTQLIVSPIPGKIDKWYVREGQLVQKGDTLVKLLEIKEDYLDPQLIARTEEQIIAKNEAIQNYGGKVTSGLAQISSLKSERIIKIKQIEIKNEQLERKLETENNNLKAAELEFEMAKDQYQRQLKMFENGLVSQTQLQQRNVSFQMAEAKKIAVKNNIIQLQQESLNNQNEKSRIEQEYNEKINKTTGDIYGNKGQISTTVGEISKLENLKSNYTIRQQLYYVLAPQDGQIIRSNKSGIGEIIKEGENIMRIVPSSNQLAVELFIRPVDIPLLEVNQEVRIVFDGYPAIVFSGWPQGSYGTFGGNISMIENSTSENGQYRILVRADNNFKKWPKELRLGTGANTIILLKDVPIWYEIWRNINGFPPIYYKKSMEENNGK